METASALYDDFCSSVVETIVRQAVTGGVDGIGEDQHLDDSSSNGCPLVPLEGGVAPPHRPWKTWLRGLLAAAICVSNQASVAIQSVSIAALESHVILPVTVDQHVGGGVVAATYNGEACQFSDTLFNPTCQPWHFHEAGYIPSCTTCGEETENAGGK